MPERQRANSPSQRKRPSLFKPEIMAEILDKVSQGETLRAVCAPSTMPHSRTVYRWIRDTPGLREKWEMAKELKSHHLIDEALDLTRMLIGPTGNGLMVNANQARALNMAIETLKDLAGRLNPKAYGPRQTGSTIIPIQINTNMNLGQDGPAERNDPDAIYSIEVPQAKLVPQ